MYLLRDGATADEGSLRSRPGMRPIPVRDSFESIAGVFLLSGEIKQPGWLTELAEISDLDLDDESFQGQSHGAIVLVERQGRIAAVTFGTGFHAVDPSLIERGFGLRVTANVVAAGKIRGAQTRGVASNSRDQKTLLPVDGEFYELDVEVDEDWLRQLSGKSADQAFAMSLAGSDSLRITVRDFSLKAISAKVDQVLTLYKGVEYRKKFPFLDQITPIDRADPVIERLDELVTAQLRGHEPTIAFASPDPFERDEQFDHYELTCGYHGRFIVDDLDNDAVFSVIDQLGESRDPLTDIRVFALDADGELVDSVHTLKSYVQTEIQLDETDFLLSAGLWFVIRKDFSAKVHEQIANIPDLTDELTLPAWNATALRDDPSDPTPEGSYNIALHQERGYVLLDKNLVRFEAHEKLEISDLLTPDGELLCVKAASKSPALSHLVAQAVDSSAAWGDPKYTAMLSAAWTQLHGANSAPLQRSDATFVLAIATTKPGPLKDSLFFFTKVQIANCLKLVTRHGFKVALARIEMEPLAARKAPRNKKKPTFTPAEDE